MSGGRRTVFVSWKPYRMFPCVVLTIFVGCAHLVSVKRAPEIGKEAVRIPLIDPVASPMAVVLAEIANPARGTRVTCRMLVDTGADRTTISASVARDLGLDVREDTDGAIRAVAGMRHRAFWAEVPLLRLGSLALTRVPVFVARKMTGRWALLGNDIVGQRPMLVDKARGWLVLNAPPLGQTATHRLAFDPGAEGSDPRVNVTLAGRSLWLALDTGARRTSLDQETGTAMALPTGWYDKPRKIQTAFGHYVAHGYFQVHEASWGTLKLRGLKVFPLPKMQAGGGLFDHDVVGLLGMDALAWRAFRIGPKTRTVELQPQADVVATATERTTRWPQLASCTRQHPCIEAALEPVAARQLTNTSEPALHFRLQSNLDDTSNWRFLFGFTDPKGAIMAHLPLVEVCGKVLSRKTSLVGRFPRELGQQLLTEFASRPASLVLLDANPAQPGNACTSQSATFHLRRPWWNT